MDIVLLKFVCKNLSLFENGELEVDFTTEKRVGTEEAADNIVAHLFNRIYKLNSLALIGINASGKTITLNIISTILQTFIENESLSYDSKLKEYFEEALEIETYFFDKGDRIIYKLLSTVNKDIIKQELKFKEEFLYKKNISSRISKKNLFDFLPDDLIIQRNTLDQLYLKNEDSIFSAVLNKKKSKYPASIDMSLHTNFNYLAAYNEELDSTLINYLDPSIEEFKMLASKEGKPGRNFSIKFKGNSNVFEATRGSLENYLSSGTIKGISFLVNLQSTFLSGGYLLVDEIENHLNKSIVLSLIRLFNSNTNKKNATLVFTTHYVEILDSISRSDSIYILFKTEKITMARFSDVGKELDRTDKKKSQVFLSGHFNTAPSYNNYINYKRALKHYLEEKSNG